jgi:vancomycin permeability regulator SanA
MLASRIKQLVVIALGSAFAVLLVGTVTIAVAGLNDDLGKADVGLVLGNKVELDGTPSLRLQARLDKTLELYRAGFFSTVITSGGLGKEGYDEALVMRDYLVSHGIPSDRVIVDNGGNSTYLSAKNTLRIAQEQKLHSVLVVTQYFHVPRARLALERFGFTTVYSAHARFFEIRDVFSSPREFVGYVSYLLRPYPSTPTPEAHATSLTHKKSTSPS